MTDRNTAGQYVAVFGAVGGIGRAVAREFAAQGWQLALADRDLDQVRELATELANEFGVPVSPWGFDARDRSAVRSMLEQASAAFGRLASVIDLIGIAPVRHFLNVTDEEWRTCLDVNLTSAFVIGQEAARLMVEHKRGSVVMMSSTSAHIAHGSQAAYSASKSGIEALVRTMAVDLGPLGIRVNAIAPGTIMTPLNLQSVTEDGRRERLKRIPLGRFGEPADVAALAYFLASEAASFISGESIRVDAGFMITGIVPPTTESHEAPR
ncbi:SDR family NAD(P)-dependent oxidoreductase [Microtetraspora sp. NBRC 16547]|uniref:SDR family NAD(P)-dependent oxidoreductase n=1 Tax=Microtetraspora sp. NBRC 16547 TaxID=3030993 RepID=UPI0024A107E1|nr:SDR family NAD(P)-dependent oxidoreductase [Microtetraspora sp. NBRC 16547]GLW98279.1 3-oxoacyl-ACP reductase [Microtetraspora sp. NBRC 16547]